MNRGSSTRLTAEPRTSWTSVAIVVSFDRWSGVDGCGRRGGGAGAHHRGRLADRRDDVVVASAAADVALDRVPDLVVGRVGVASEQIARRHDHARLAEAALEAVLRPEAFLER